MAKTSDINKVILIGNCGENPLSKETVTDTTITNVSLATSKVWKDKHSGELKEETQWHRIVFFNQLATIAATYLKKGSRVYIEGSLQTRKWQDQKGQDRYTTEIIAKEMLMLDGHSNTTAEDTVKAAPEQPFDWNDEIDF